MEQRRNILFTVGIDKYKSESWKDLDNAVNDCKALRDVLLNKYFFEEYPESLFDNYATKQNIYDSFNGLIQYVEPQDNVVIFFAGHGNMNPHTKRGYWIPHDGTFDLVTWIENSVIKDFIQDINVKHIWLIADSCFSGTFLTKTRGFEKETKYITLDSRKSRWMLSSGSEEKVSDGDPGTHSPFTKFLLKYLNINTNKYTSVSEIIKYVQVLMANNSRQKPRGTFIENIGHEDGEMILILNDEDIQSKIEITKGITNTPELRREYFLNKKIDNKIPTGKEILFVESFVEGADYLILENFRFDDKGNKKLSFEENKVILKGKDEDLKLNLIQRFATWQGLNKYLDIHKNLTDFKIVTIHAHEDIETVEELPSSQAHGEYLQQLLDYNKDIMSCLHCGEKISTNDCHLVEIEELGLLDNIGNVHKECLRPIDRILGHSGYQDLPDSNLINFNYSLWGDLLREGQGQLVAIEKMQIEQKIFVISWNPKNNINNGKYCIKEHFDNGECKFVMLGKEIHRFTDKDIDNELEFFSSFLNHNPPAMIIENKTFGPYETLLLLKKTDQTISKVTHYSKFLYSKQFELNSNIKNDYTPIGLVKYAESDTIIKFGNIVPLISKPNEFEKYYQNWKHIESNIEKCTLKIISSDFELDTHLQLFFKENLQPIINPYFDIKNKTIESGMLIKDFETIISEKLKENGKWKEGDKVKVVFPGLKTDKYATGQLLTDEFIDEEGEKCVIFQPIDNGKPIKDMMFKMPSKLLKRLDE